MRSLLFIVLLLLVHSNGASAAVVEGLYNASVIVTDQSANAQKKAVKQALAEVLVKVSGNRALLADDEVKTYLNRAENILLSYAFESTPDGLLYKAEFDTNKVESLLRSTGFSIWGKHRPQTLIWLAMEEQGTNRRELVSDSTHAEVILAAKKAAAARGVDIAFPIMDLTDIQQVSVYDVWSSYTQNLVLASERYATEYVMSGRLYYRDEQPFSNQNEQQNESQNTPQQLDVWVVEWMITRKGVFDSGESSGETPEIAIKNAVDMFTDVLADKYAIEAISDNENNKTKVVIGNISSLTAYVEVLNFLTKLSVVVDVALVEQQGSLATFELELFGAEENLEEAFRLEDRLQRSLDDYGQPVQDKPYVWRP
ncbi:DUF2066 domain-containing protein [Aliiglaciecola lipolytica]|uniref:DUF2066 domain-containing protein n=1 Tax=Aliiglaciecola lipolytica E3 TaxID=1127673 RepID=K6XS83_9ALTE|nr:DUF2066 domain-containing protein [Aliiglaciecola lipolytica]GAC14541.1 hypothetical protein GLIP_1913 [Aliiglaciecola lipolytica E3]